jgi:uncharacterized DUF497 family protein
MRRAFEWDPRKATINVTTHRVRFEEAATVFDDGFRIEELDETHSTDREERLRVLGLSSRLRMLLVIYAERDQTIRIISARRATKAESLRYAREG